MIEKTDPCQILLLRLACASANRQSSVISRRKKHLSMICFQMKICILRDFYYFTEADGPNVYADRIQCLSLSLSRFFSDH